ncbi:MAG: hypothetical protein M5U15_05100 [Kiritimatiellae bacterium]|nr:hypothetical protein [Kiritimatiellia bacterium]
MEEGTDIYTIKRWMGHTALVTTGPLHARHRGSTWPG